MKKLFIIITLGLVFSTGLQAQNFARDSKERGENYFQYGEYEKALDQFLRFQKEKPKDIDTKYYIGRCYLHLGDAEEADRYLKHITSVKKSKYEAFLYYARVSHEQHEFERAIRHYKDYLRNMKPKDEGRDWVKDQIRRCLVGTKLKWQNSGVYVENMGASVNSEFDEFSPVMNGKYKNTLYFTSNRRGSKGGLYYETTKGKTEGKYRSDIYYSVLSQGSWTVAEGLSGDFNTIMHDVVCDFNSAGDEILLMKGEKTESGVVMQRAYNPESDEYFRGIAMSEVINSPYYDGAVDLFQDSVLLFVSDKRLWRNGYLYRGLMGFGNPQ